MFFSKKKRVRTKHQPIIKHLNLHLIPHNFDLSPFHLKKILENRLVLFLPPFHTEIQYLFSQVLHIEKKTSDLVGDMELERKLDEVDR